MAVHFEIQAPQFECGYEGQLIMFSLSNAYARCVCLGNIDGLIRNDVIGFGDNRGPIVAVELELKDWAGRSSRIIKVIVKIPITETCSNKKSLPRFANWDGVTVFVQSWEHSYSAGPINWRVAAIVLIEHLRLMLIMNVSFVPGPHH